VIDGVTVGVTVVVIDGVPPGVLDGVTVIDTVGVGDGDTQIHEGVSHIFSVNALKSTVATAVPVVSLLNA
jgi:hypothetical protein